VVETWKNFLYSSRSDEEGFTLARSGKRLAGIAFWIRPHSLCAPAERELFVPLACTITHGCSLGW
jgi:hypothetical protein